MAKKWWDQRATVDWVEWYVDTALDDVYAAVADAEKDMQSKLLAVYRNFARKLQLDEKELEELMSDQSALDVALSDLQTAVGNQATVVDQRLADLEARINAGQQVDLSAEIASVRADIAAIGQIGVQQATPATP